MKKLPIKAAKDVAKKYGLDQVILLCRDFDADLVHRVTYGVTKDDCKMAAFDGQKIGAMLEACPTSLEAAISAAQGINVPLDEATIHMWVENLEGLSRERKIEAFDDALHILNFGRRLASLTDKQLTHMNDVENLTEGQRKRLDTVKTDEDREIVIEEYARTAYFRECAWIDYLNGAGKVPIEDTEQL